MPDSLNDNDLIGNFDATAWAKRFVQRMADNPDMARDTGAMTAWFASAIMAGYDRGKQEAEQVTDSAATTRTVEHDRITSVCSVCGDSVEAPNKGLGRATVAAWESNHGRNCSG